MSRYQTQTLVEIHRDITNGQHNYDYEHMIQLQTGINFRAVWHAYFKVGHDLDRCVDVFRKQFQENSNPPIPKPNSRVHKPEPPAPKSRRSEQETQKLRKLIQEGKPPNLRAGEVQKAHELNGDLFWFYTLHGYWMKQSKITGKLEKFTPPKTQILTEEDELELRKNITTNTLGMFKSDHVLMLKGRYFFYDSGKGQWMRETKGKWEYIIPATIPRNLAKRYNIRWQSNEEQKSNENEKAYDVPLDLTA